MPGTARILKGAPHPIILMIKRQVPDPSQMEAKGIAVWQRGIPANYRRDTANARGDEQEPSPRKRDLRHAGLVGRAGNTR